MQDQYPGLEPSTFSFSGHEAKQPNRGQIRKESYSVQVSIREFHPLEARTWVAADDSPATGRFPLRSS